MPQRQVSARANVVMDYDPARATLLKRVGQPTDIAKSILFLASEEASYITGETIHVDGGNRLLV